MYVDQIKTNIFLYRSHRSSNRHCLWFEQLLICILHFVIICRKINQRRRNNFFNKKKFSTYRCLLFDLFLLDDNEIDFDILDNLSKIFRTLHILALNGIIFHTIIFIMNIYLLFRPSVLYSIVFGNENSTWYFQR